MIRKAALLVLLVFPALCAGKTPGSPKGMVRIDSGSFRPLYAPPSQSVVRVGAFSIDSVPVSAAKYAAFAHLSPVVDARLPAAGVTWSQATAYCAARGARLPSTIEWEYVARADEERRDAAASPAFRQRALQLAIAARPAAFRIGTGLRNIWGVRDLHGGIAEWTSDFNGSAHGHNSGRHTATMTCASGTVEAGDASDYAAFLRYSLRSTLTVGNSLPNVGFRCAV